MSVFCCVVLSCVGTGLETGRSLIQGVKPKCQNWISLIKYSESVQVRRPNQGKLKKKKKKKKKKEEEKYERSHYVIISVI